MAKKRTYKTIEEIIAENPPEKCLSQGSLKKTTIDIASETLPLGFQTLGRTVAYRVMGVNDSPPICVLGSYISPVPFRTITDT